MLNSATMPRVSRAFVVSNLLRTVWGVTSFLTFSTCCFRFIDTMVTNGTASGPFITAFSIFVSMPFWMV